MSMTESERLTERNKKGGAYSSKDFTDVVDKLAAFEDIGTVSEFRELKEKATAKKPKKVVGYGMFDCPHCNTILPIGKKYPHCTWCGGLIDYDWSEGKE